MKKIRQYDIHDKFLKEYADAAIENAQQILDAAKILLGKKSFAIAYFLSVAAIEETGKAYMAFTARGRNLTDSGLKKKVLEMFGKHPKKIISAFIGWILKSSKSEESITTAVELMFHLNHGREKSMYVDANADNSLSIPSQTIRPVAAINALKVAENCLHHTKNYISKNNPPVFSSFDDKLFCLRSEKIKEMFNKDFGKYLISGLKQQSGNFDFSRAIVTYHDKYFSKKKLFEKT